MKDTPSRAPRFYMDAALRAGGTCVLSEDAAHHAVHVLRVRAGDAITLFNGRGGEYAARVAAIERLRISVDVLAHHAGTVKIERTLRPFAVVMAGADVFDPFKD